MFLATYSNRLYLFTAHVRVAFRSKSKHRAEPQPFTRWVARPVTLICKEGSEELKPLPVSVGNDYFNAY